MTIGREKIEIVALTPGARPRNLQRQLPPRKADHTQAPEAPASCNSGKSDTEFEDVFVNHA